MGEAPALTPVALRLGMGRRFGAGFLIDATRDAPLAPGAILVLFGPSGAGKTTILRHIAGLERAPDERVQFNDDVWSDAARHLWLAPQDRRAGIVFQDPTLFPHLSVRDNIEFGLAIVSRDARARRSAEVGDLLGVTALFDRLPSALSGGEARRVALARALAPSPRLLLLDEPVSAVRAPRRPRLRHDVRRT